MPELAFAFTDWQRRTARNQAQLKKVLRGGGVGELKHPPQHKKPPQPKGGRGSKQLSMLFYFNR